MFIVDSLQNPPKKCTGYGKSERPHKLTKQSVLNDIRGQLSKQPFEIYKQLNDKDNNEAPRYIKQIRNMKYREGKRKMGDIGMQNNNIADHILQTACMIQDNEFVQVMIHMKGKPPSVILYTTQQLNHLLACAGREAVVCIDRTFNLYFGIDEEKALRKLSACAFQNRSRYFVRCI